MPNFRHRPEHKQGLIPGMGRMSDRLGPPSRMEQTLPMQQPGLQQQEEEQGRLPQLGLKKSKAKTIRPSFEPGGSRKKKKR